MKFLCSNCKAKYQIPDEKIAGRTLKMDCRRCNTPITIRGDQPQPEELDAEPDEPQPRAAAPASASARSRPGTSSVGRPSGAASGGSSVGAHPAGAGIAARTTGRSALGADFRRNVGGAGGLAHAAEAPRVTPLDQWHVAINDVPVGPMKRDEIARKIAAGAANADSLAWREGFDDWRPIREIPELAALLRRATQESDRPPAGRPGAPRAPAPRAPAPRPGAMPAPGARSPLGAPAAARASRNNVVPIGGRHGASVAPSYEPDDGDDDDLSGGEGEATTIASAADLGLGDFGKPVRDDGDIPSPHAKREEKPAPKGPTGGFKPIPPPGARPLASAPASRVSAPAAKPAAATPAPKPVAPVAARVEPLDDPFGLPPAEPEPKRASFAPPPPAMDVGAPILSAASPARPVPVTPQREQRAGGGLGVGAMMGIGFAMAAGAVLMYGVVQRFVLATPPPTTTVVATVATIAPPVSEAQHDAVLDDVPPPSSTVAAPPTTGAAPPPTTTVATGATPHHTGSTGGTSPPTTGARPPTTRAPAGDDPFAAFADDGAGPAPIATTTTARHDDVAAAHHSSAELTADQINTVRRGGQRALTQCWEGALRTAGHVDGDVRYDIDITIGTSGTVTLVHARGPTVGTLQDCLERAVRRWVFPPSASVTQTAFPIVFSAQQ